MGRLSSQPSGGAREIRHAQVDLASVNVAIVRAPAAFVLLLALLTLLFSVICATAQPKLTLTFQIQYEPHPRSIELRPAGKDSGKKIEYSTSRQTIVLMADDFSNPLETFTVTVKFEAEEDQYEFDLRTMAPLVEAQVKILLMKKPKANPSYARTKAAIESMDDAQIAFAPYLVCRQTYPAAAKNFAVSKDGDRVTQVDAALCWLTANAKLVFANPGGIWQRLYAPDASAIAAAESVLGKPEDPKTEDQQAWREALGQRAPAFRDLARVRDDILRLKLAQWHFFPRRNELRKVYGIPRYCSFMAMLREGAPKLSEGERLRLTRDPFVVTPQDMAALQAEAPSECRASG